jgi:Cu/Zn superoxide dismutase
MPNRKLLIGGLAVAALSLGIAGCRPFTASTAGHATTDQRKSIPAHGSVGSGKGTETSLDRYRLHPMPTGTVVLTRTPGRELRAKINMFGLTPGSAHGIYIDEPDGHRIAFPVLTADPTGQVATTLTSLRSVVWHANPGRFVIQLGPIADPIADEPIAETNVFPPQPGVEQTGVLHAVGVNTGGYATVRYEPNNQTLSVTITAHGLNPGPHAAHIHVGSCKSQGPVKYMLADFIADTHGDVVNQTRTIRNVPTVSAHGGWYLNVHQGGMNEILANGAPTLNFRPLLCTNIRKRDA